MQVMIFKKLQQSYAMNALQHIKGVDCAKLFFWCLSTIAKSQNVSSTVHNNSLSLNRSSSFLENVQKNIEKGSS